MLNKTLKCVLLIVCIIFMLLMIYNNLYIPEDVNRDGEVTALDLLKVQKYLLERED